MKRYQIALTTITAGILMAACSELPTDPIKPVPSPLPIPTPTPTPTPVPTPTPSPTASATNAPVPSPTPLPMVNGSIGAAGGQLTLAGVATATVESGTFAGGTAVTLAGRFDSDKPWGDFAQITGQFDLATGAFPARAVTLTVAYNPALLNGVDPSYIRLTRLEAGSGTQDGTNAPTTYRYWNVVGGAPTVDATHRTVTFAIEKPGSFTLVAPARPVAISAGTYWANPGNYLDVGDLSAPVKTLTGYSPIGYHLVVNNVALPGLSSGQSAAGKPEAVTIVNGPVAQSGTTNRGDVVRAWTFDKVQRWSGSVGLDAQSTPTADKRWNWKETLTLTFDVTSDGQFTGDASSAYAQTYTAPLAGSVANGSLSGTVAYKVKGTLSNGVLTFHFEDQPAVAPYTAVTAGGDLTGVDDDLASVYLVNSGKGTFTGSVSTNALSLSDTLSLTSTPWLPATIARTVSLTRTN